MFNKIKNVGKRVKKYMEEKVEVCKEFIRDDKNRLIMSLVMIGTGVGLFASVYIKVPQ